MQGTGRGASSGGEPLPPSAAVKNLWGTMTIWEETVAFDGEGEIRVVTDGEIVIGTTSLTCQSNMARQALL